jgi:hypothetical protein
MVPSAPALARMKVVRCNARCRAGEPNVRCRRGVRAGRTHTPAVSAPVSRHAGPNAQVCLDMIVRRWSRRPVPTSSKEPCTIPLPCRDATDATPYGRVRNPAHAGSTGRQASSPAVAAEQGHGMARASVPSRRHDRSRSGSGPARASHVHLARAKQPLWNGSLSSSIAVDHAGATQAANNLGDSTRSMCGIRMQHGCRLVHPPRSVLY